MIFYLVGACCIGFLLFVLIIRRVVSGKCTRCQQRYYYSNAKVTPSNATSSLKETKWKRDGKKAVEMIRYPLCREWKCKKCDTISYTWVWSTNLSDWTKPYRDEKSFWHERLAKSEWKEEGGSFDVQDCPMCDSSGSLNVVVDDHVTAVFKREHYGRGLCGFCNGEGCIKPEKLDSLQRK